MEIFKAFRKLGWNLQHHGCGFYSFITPDKKELNLQIWFPSDGEIPCRIKEEFDNYRGGIDFEFNRCYFEWLDKTCISINVDKVKNTPCFINFSNHDHQDQRK